MSEQVQDPRYPGSRTGQLVSEVLYFMQVEARAKAHFDLVPGVLEPGVGVRVEFQGTLFGCWNVGQFKDSRYGAIPGSNQFLRHQRWVVGAEADHTPGQGIQKSGQNTPASKSWFGRESLNHFRLDG